MRKLYLITVALILAIFLQTSFLSKKARSFAFINASYADEAVDDNSWAKDNSPEEDKNKEDKLKVIKNLNTILVDSYKTKLDQILDNLKDNIKDDTKENQIKTFSNILIPLNQKIKTIETKKEISINRKEVLLEVLKHIKNNLEADIKDLLDQK